MARPVYTICVRSGSEDKETGLLSLFEVVETLQTAPLPPPGPGGVILALFQPFRVYSVWMREESDDWEQEYEYEFALILPPNDDRPHILQGRFRFDQPERKPFYRLVTQFNTPLQLPSAGIMRAETRVRKVGKTDWLVQSYPVIVEELPGTPPPDGAAPA